jgi:hypothetical protein
MDVFVAWFSMPVFGKGVGIGGKGGAGTRHTSGTAIQFPPILVDAGNINKLLFIQDEFFQP